MAWCKGGTANVLLSNVWATWCVPCVEEFPESVATSRKSDLRNFEFISISTDELRDSAHRVRKTKYLLVPAFPVATVQEIHPSLVLMFNASILSIAMLCLAAAAHTQAALRLTLSASSLPNDFNGVLVHSISGISEGEAVSIHRFADLNENGQVEDGEPLVRSFQITDGVRPIIGGVVNRNVPGDDDGLANSAIRVDFVFGGPDAFFSRQVGKFLIRVSGETEEVTMPFEVSQPDLGQRIAGIVRNSADNSPIPFATVIVAVSAGGDYVPVANVRSDSQGAYHFNARAGTYSLVALPVGFVGGLVATTVAPGQTRARDLFATPGTTQVSGLLADDSELGLPSVAVFCQTGGDGNRRLFALGLTDANGEYAVRVTSGGWTVRPATESMAQLGYLADGSGTTITAASVPITVNLPATRASSLIYGRVSDTSGAAIAGVGVFAFPNFASGLEAAGASLANGDYFIGVSGGSWEFETFGALVSGFHDLRDRPIQVASGAAVRSDIVLPRITTRLRGRVVDASGVGIEGVFFSAHFEFDEDTSSGQFTGPDGGFDIPVRGGEWTLHIEDATHERIDHWESISITESVDATITYTVPDPTGHILGTVTSTSLVPIVGLPIRAVASIRGVEHASHAISDGTGAFRLPAINGVWNVSMDCEHLETINHQCVADRSVTVANDAPAINISVPRMDTTPHLIGRVVDSNGLGIPAVRLNASSSSGEFRNARSGPNGEFDIRVSTGDWWLLATSLAPAGKIAPYMHLTVNEGESIRDIRFEYRTVDAAIRGSLTTYEGVPVADVSFFGSASVSNITYSVQAKTDSGGQFTIPGLRELVWSVSPDCTEIGQQNLTCPPGRSLLIRSGEGTVSFVAHRLDSLDRPVMELPEINFAHQNILLQIHGRPASYDFFGALSLSSAWTRMATLSIPPGAYTLRVQFAGALYHFYRVEMRVEP